MENILNAAIESFKQTFKSICQNSPLSIDKIDQDDFARMTRVLMDAAQAAGQAGLSEYLRQHDITQPNIIHDGVAYRYKGTGTNELLTLFGTIGIKRAIYHNQTDGGKYFIPLDHAIGMEKNDFATMEVRGMLLYAIASCVPNELSKLLEMCSLCRPSTTAIQNIVCKDGAVMEALSEQLSKAIVGGVKIPETTNAIVASLDGANVLLREPGEKKGRKNKRPVESECSASTTSYHNAMVGAVSFYDVDAEGKPQRISSIYTARMPEEKSTTFKHDFESMLTMVEQKFDSIGIPVSKILLTDAHLMIKGFAQSSKVLKTYEMLIDFYHVSEHLSKAADAAYGERTDWSKWWYAKWREALKIDLAAPTAILRSLKGLLKRHDLSAKCKKELETEITFFKNNKRFMKYPAFIERKLPIGSGPIEAAAKTIVKQRMCRSGMRWSREKGQYVLAIRALVQSGLWESAWNHYKQLKKVA